MTLPWGSGGDDITPGRAALRHFGPGYVGLGSKPVKLRTSKCFPVCPRKQTSLPILELLPPPAFCECRHRRLACRLVAVRRRAILMMSKEATSACWCRISRATSLDDARRGAVLRAKPYGGLDGNDEAIVHPQELLARPAALQLVAWLARGPHEQASAILMQRGTAAPPLAVVGHGVHETKGKEWPRFETLRAADREIKPAVDIENALWIRDSIPSSQGVKTKTIRARRSGSAARPACPAFLSASAWRRALPMVPFL